MAMHIYNNKENKKKNYDLWNGTTQPERRVDRYNNTHPSAIFYTHTIYLAKLVGLRKEWPSSIGRCKVISFHSTMSQMQRN